MALTNRDGLLRGMAAYGNRHNDDDASAQSGDWKNGKHERTIDSPSMPTVSHKTIDGATLEVKKYGSSNFQVSGHGKGEDGGYLYSNKMTSCRHNYHMSKKSAQSCVDSNLDANVAQIKGGRYIHSGD